MTQELLINKLMLNIEEFGMTTKEALTYAYTAGWEDGEKNANYGHKKRVKYFNRQGWKLGGPFQSLQEAAESVGCERHAITRSLQSGKPTKQGHIWKYEDNGNY